MTNENTATGEGGRLRQGEPRTADCYWAATLKRPGLPAALLTLRRRQSESLIVVKIDRLTRCVSDLAALTPVGVWVARPDRSDAAVVILLGKQVAEATQAAIRSSRATVDTAPTPYGPVTWPRWWPRAADNVISVKVCPTEQPGFPNYVTYS